MNPKFFLLISSPPVTVIADSKISPYIPISLLSPVLGVKSALWCLRTSRSMVEFCVCHCKSVFLCSSDLCCISRDVCLFNGILNPIAIVIVLAYILMKLALPWFAAFRTIDFPVSAPSALLDGTESFAANPLLLNLYSRLGVDSALASPDESMTL